MFSLACVVGLSMVMTPRLQASFIAGYAPDQFALINSNADGSAITPDGGLSLILTGGNNGSSLPGTTDFVITAPQAGLVTFDFLYSACSQTAICDTPQFDFAGYLLGTVFTQLADTTGDSGNISFAVNAGDSFGFRVGTTDNTGEPGILTVSNFSGPTDSSVPEPVTWPVICAAIAAVVLAQLFKNRNRGMENNA